MVAIFAEIISIGNELLSGSTANTNAAYISQKLKEAGFTIKRQTTISDEHEIIMETMAESLACVPLVITTGGLGPTLDDITLQAAAELFDSPLEFNPELANTLKQRFGEIESIENQATVPKKAMLLPNKVGTASGLIFYNGQSTLILLPGVPAEMQAILQEEVIPYLQRTFPQASPKEGTDLFFANLYESQVDPILREIQTRLPLLQIGIYPSNGLLKVRLEGDAREINSAQNQLDEKFGEIRYEAEDGKIETALHHLFIKSGYTLSCAESCTGGALAARLTALAGASKYFLGSMVAYSNELKQGLLGIPPTLLQEKGAVSPEVAVTMAESIQALTDSTFSVSVTGIAGPTGGSQEKPVGTIYMAYKKKGVPARAVQLKAIGNRPVIIERTVNWVLGELLKLVK